MTKLCLVTRTIAENSVIDRWIVQMWKHPGHLILKKTYFLNLYIHLRSYVYVFSIVAKASTFDLFWIRSSLPFFKESELSDDWPREFTLHPLMPQVDDLDLE